MVEEDGLMEEAGTGRPFIVRFGAASVNVLSMYFCLDVSLGCFFAHGLQGLSSRGGL